MKFHLSTGEGNFFTGYGAGYVRLGIMEYRENLIVTPEKIITPWAGGGFAGLTEQDFAAIASNGTTRSHTCRSSVIPCTRIIGSPTPRSSQAIMPAVLQSCSGDRGGFDTNSSLQWSLVFTSA